MKLYFIHNGTQQLGPFTLEELKSQNLMPTTPIWFDGQIDWSTVEQIAELNYLVNSPTPQAAVNNNRNSLKKIEK